MSESQNMQILGYFKLRISEDDKDVAYLYLPTYPKERQFKVAKSVRLSEILGPYNGPSVILDFDENGILVGIELLA